ncbi:MAG: MFS transporter [Alphaproteobacteria bacterium]
MSVAGLRVVGALAMALIISQFFRSANAALAPVLMPDLGLGPGHLGLASGAFFLSFALMQLPVGVALDRFGPRRVVSSLLLVAVVGALAFSVADSLGTLILAEALIGIGCSGTFVGGMVAIARWFRPHQFATMTALVVALSHAGNLITATPLAAAIEAFGWRNVLVAVACVAASFSLLVFLLVRDAPPDHPSLARKGESLGATLRGLGAVFRNKQLPYLLSMAFVAFPSALTVRGLWAGPFLHDVYGLTSVELGNALLYISLAMIAGVLLYGPLDRLFDSRKRVALGGAFGTAALCAALALGSALPFGMALVLMVMLGLVGSYYVYMMPHGRALFPEQLVGRAVTTVNLSTFIGTGVMQAMTGFIIEAIATGAVPVPAEAYRAVFGFIALVTIIAALLYSRIADVRPSAERAGPRGR